MSTAQGSLYGHTLLSDVALSWLDNAPVVDDPIRIVVTDTSSFRTLDPTTPSCDQRDGIAFQTLDDGRVVCEMARLGAFVLKPAALEIFAPEPTQHRSIWEHTLYAWAIPLLLASSGRLVLHGAAIDTGAGALVVIGESTRGKTSFAAEAVRRGYRLLGEDGIAVRIDSRTGTPIAYPGCLGVRLRHGPDGTPRRKVTSALPASSRCSQALPLAAVVALAPRTPTGSAPEIGGAALAIAALRANCFAMPEALAGLYPTIVGIARTVPVASVALRDGLSFLGEEVDRLVRWCHQAGIAA